MKKKFLKYLLYPVCLLLVVNAHAQSTELLEARSHADKQEWSKAADAYKKIYRSNPVDADIYKEYLYVLLQDKDYKTAENIVEDQLKIKRNHPLQYVDMGRVYIAAGKQKKGEEQFDQALLQMNGDDILTQQLAAAFTALGREDYTLKTFERARDLLRNPYFYSGPLSRLYAKTGAIDKAVFTLLETNPGLVMNTDDTKATLLEILGTDAKKQQQAQKALIKKINEQPENPYFSELLTWLYTQKDDWDGAMLQVEALDERNRENGERLLEFARYATKENKYEYAIKAYDAIVAKGIQLPYYSISHSERLTVRFAELQANPAFTQEQVTTLGGEYDKFLFDYPQFYASQTARDYAKLMGEYGNNPQKGIEILKRALSQPTNKREFEGLAKLQMGDYYIITGEVWEASLIYSQVDKAFREDVLGEEARFRNAKLAYYRGDFEWAQGQLSVLKASTTELIANDALYLSVLITENIDADSNYVPIQRFAHSDFLLFQNKDKEAEAILDSLLVAFPEHALKDDILMQKAKLATKHLDYTKALAYMKEVIEKHGKDVLADDAIFKTAELYQLRLKQPDEAKKYYEQLIIDFPGSTYVQVARNRLAEMNGGQVIP
jgi:tetratricopeptide (TPR) repeat protein